MGLLDPTDAALLSLGAGLLGGGSRAQAMGRGAQGFMSTYQAAAQAQAEQEQKARELAIQDEIRKAQIQNYQSEIKAREQQQALAQQKQAQIQGLLSEFTTPQAPINAASAALAGGGGPTMANAANLPQPNPADRMGMIQRMAVAGVPGVSTLFDVEKWKADPLKMEPGSTYQNRLTNQRETIPRLPEGGQMDGGRFSFLPGYQESITGLEGAKAGAVERAKAGMDLTTITPAGSTNPVMTTRGELVSSMRPSGITTNMVGDPSAVRAQIMAQVPPDQRDAVMAAYERELAGGRGVAVQSEEEKAAAQARIGTEATTATTANKAIIDELQSSKKTAIAASRNLDTIGRLTDAVDSGKLMLGPTSTFLQYGMQLANVLGVSGRDINERLSNTRLAIQGFAQMALDAAPQLANQGQITENERILLARANSGNINELTPPELRTLLGVLDRASRLQIESHQSLVRNASGVKGLESFLPTVNVDMPGIRKSKPSIDDLLKKYGGS